MGIHSTWRDSQVPSSNFRALPPPPELTSRNVMEALRTITGPSVPGESKSFISFGSLCRHFGIEMAPDTRRLEKILSDLCRDGRTRQAANGRDYMQIA